MVNLWWLVLSISGFQSSLKRPMVDDTQSRDVKNCSDNQENVSRRNTLKGVGLGIAGISGIAQIGGTDGHVEIVTEIGRNENATERVPKEWHEYEQRVDEALYVARNNYKSVSGIQGISIVPSNRTRGGKKSIS